MTASPAPSDSPDSPAAYVVRTPEDLIAMVPFVLGFHPRESLVLLTFRSDDAGFHARVDLPTTRAERSALVQQMLGPVRAHAIAAAAVVVLSDDPGTAGVARTLVTALEREGVSVLDAIRVETSRWFRLQPGGEAPGVLYDVSAHPFAAARVLDGQTTFADRDALAASIAPQKGELGAADRAEVQRSADAWVAATFGARGPTDDLVGLGPAYEMTYQRCAQWLLGRLGRLTRPGPRPPLSAAVVARLCVLARVGAMRGVLQQHLTRASAPRHVELWREVTRRAPADLVEGPAAMLALAAWLAGDGALGWCAVDRCCTHAGRNPGHGYDLAELVATALTSAVSPEVWVDLCEPTELDELTGTAPVVPLQRTAERRLGGAVRRREPPTGGAQGAGPEDVAGAGREEHGRDAS